jgi:hypothetical protein
MKNTTLSRKPTNDMKKNSGFQPDSRRSDQSGDGEDFAFNGQMGDGVNRSKSTERFAGNQSDQAMKENYGMGPRKGNIDKDSRADTLDKVPYSTAAGGLIDGGRKWEPKAGQNYTGNADKIYVGSGPRKGNE